MEIFGIPTALLGSQLLVGLINGSFYAILSLGLAIIFGLLNIINFAHGAQYMMGAFVAWIALTRFGINYWVSLIAAPLIVGIVGVLIERPIDLDERMRSLEASYARAQSAVVAAEAQRKDTQARGELARLNAKRYLDLGEKRFVSSSAVESKQQELTSAQAAHESADANLLGARQELTRLKADQEGLRQQRQNLRLMAPRDGIVTSRDAEPGSTVIAGQSVVKLIEPESLWVKVRLDQGRSRGLTVGLPAQVSLRSNLAAKLNGKVARVEPVSDSVTEERIAFVALEKLPSGLTVGELAEVSVNTTPGISTPTLPNAAIKHTVQGTGIWVVREGKPVFAKVAVGETSLDGLVQIRDGLHEGDVVITYSEKELAEGSRIKVVERLVGSKS